MLCNLLYFFSTCTNFFFFVDKTKPIETMERLFVYKEAFSVNCFTI